MEEYCQNPLCENKAVKEVPVSVVESSDQVRSLCAACDEAFSWGLQHGTMLCEGLKIDLPPEEKGDEPLFRVVYVIDVNAGDAREAAEYTHRIMTDPQSQRPVLQVIDPRGRSTEIDLSEDGGLSGDSRETAGNQAADRLKGSPENAVENRKEPATESFTKTTVGFVVQTFRKNSKGRYVCTHQEFIAGDPCDYEDIDGAPVEPPDYEYQPYHMTLRSGAACETTRASWLLSAYEAIEEVLESLDVGGEQSRQFANEIKILREAVCFPEPPKDAPDEARRRHRIVHTLRRLAAGAEGLTVSLPALPVAQWLDGTVADETKDVSFENHDLAKLLQFMADAGVSIED